MEPRRTHRADLTDGSSASFDDEGFATKLDSVEQNGKRSRRLRRRDDSPPHGGSGVSRPLVIGALRRPLFVFSPGTIHRDLII